MSTTQQDHQAAKSFYDRISSAYDLIADSGEHKAREAGLRLLNIQPGEEVLEIGYGTGRSIVELARAVGPEGRVFGVDISEGMHQIAAERVAKEGLEGRVELQTAAVPPIPCEDASLDAAVMSFTLELFPLDIIPEVLGEVRRVLKPGGRVGIVSMATVPERQNESVLEHLYKWMHQHFPHIVDCQPIDTTRFLEEAGFMISERIDMEIWTMPVVAVVGAVGT